MGEMPFAWPLGQTGNKAEHSHVIQNVLTLNMNRTNNNQSYSSHWGGGVKVPSVKKGSAPEFTFTGQVETPPPPAALIQQNHKGA